MDKLELLTNRCLFNLTALDIPIGLRNFLKGTLPWEIMGKSLSSFLCAMIEGFSSGTRIKGTIMEDAYLADDNIVIESGAVVYPGAYIAGPTYICAGAVVGQGAFVRGNVFLARDTLVGHCTEIKGSILLPRAKAPHFNYVGDSILGADVNLGAGVKTANLRFDNQPVLIKVDGRMVQTGLRKFGAAFANKTQAGCNSVTNPGTIILPGAFVRPCTNVHGIISSDS